MRTLKIEKLKFIHQTGVIILLGFAFGAILYYGIDDTILFEDYIFFDELLPIIIFAAGFNLKRRRFVRNIGYIMTYGVIGTIFTFILITVGIWGCTKLDIVDLKLIECMVIASVLASSDAVAVLTIMKEEDSPQLYSILFGEGIINDAVSIILFDSVKRNTISFESDDVSWLGILVGLFLLNFIGSMLIGTFFGLLSALITKHCYSLAHETVFEMALLFLIAYFAYLVAMLINFSGVLTVLI